MVSREDFACLNRASITYDYLHTNSTTHEFLFGAIAELVDNARDAHASTLHIDFENDMLSFLDDGCGMDKKETVAVASFGYSLKKLDATMIGQYGNGLKSGALRIAKDFVLLTKKDGLLTALLLSRSFHEKNGLKEVIVPSPSFTINGEAYCESQSESHKHEIEMAIMTEWSPWRSQQELLQQFHRIPGHSGTLVVCFNLRRVESGSLELDFESESDDVRLRDLDRYGQVDEHSSLRAYLAVLYLNPRMRVFIRGKKVTTKRILSTLFKPRQYKYLARNLRACAERQYERCKKEVIDAKDHLGLCRSSQGEFERAHGDYMRDAMSRVRFRHLQNAVSNAEALVAAVEMRCEKIAKTRNTPSPLIFYFGLNVLERKRYGCMIYNNGRLIRVYEKLNSQKDKSEIRMKGLGVVGVVDVPYSLLEPTHNKQAFADHREYMLLQKALNDHLEQYWKDIALFAEPNGVTGFWKSLGYASNDWTSDPSSDASLLMKRYRLVGFCVQCDVCLKWRHLDFDPRFLTPTGAIPSNWRCEMHPDSLFQQCTRIETMAKIPVGQLLRRNDEEEGNGGGKEAAKAVVAKVEVPVVTRGTEPGRGSRVGTAPTSPPRRSSRSAALRTRSPPPSHTSLASPRSKRRHLGGARRRSMPMPGNRKKMSSDEEEEEESSGEEEPVVSRRRRSSPSPKASPVKAKTKADLLRKKLSGNGPSSSYSTRRGDGDVDSSDQSVEDPVTASCSSRKPVRPARPQPALHLQEKVASNAAVFEKLRRLFVYFKPPEMNLAVGKLSDDELLHIDIEQFTASYETGLRDLMKKQTHALVASNKNLRELAARLFHLYDEVAAVGVTAGNVEERLGSYFTERK